MILAELVLNTDPPSDRPEDLNPRFFYYTCDAVTIALKHADSNVSSSGEEEEGGGGGAILAL